MNRILLTLAVVFGVSYVALSKMRETESPKVYRLAKVEAPTTLPVAEAKTPELELVAAESWEARPAQGMRYASFSAGGSGGGEEADISVVFLPGNCGSDLANINRWREQINLGRWTTEEMERNCAWSETPLGRARVVKLMADADFAANSLSAPAIFAAIVPVQHGTWFIKLSGERTILESEEENFALFLSHISEKNE